MVGGAGYSSHYGVQQDAGLPCMLQHGGTSPGRNQFKQASILPPNSMPRLLLFCSTTMDRRLFGRAPAEMWLLASQPGLLAVCKAPLQCTRMLRLPPTGSAMPSR